MLHVLDLLGFAAAVLDDQGSVRLVNDGASKLFDDSFAIREGRLYAADPRARDKLEDFVIRLCTGDETRALRTIVARHGRLPILIDAAKPAGSRNPTGGCDALLLFTDIEEPHMISAPTAEEAFGLTTSQAKVASMLAGGRSLAQIAGVLGLTAGTVRNHLKEVFARTGTCRQGELVSLLSRLR